MPSRFDNEAIIRLQYIQGLLTGGGGGRWLILSDRIKSAYDSVSLGKRERGGGEVGGVRDTQRGREREREMREG